MNENILSIRNRTQNKLSRSGVLLSEPRIQEQSRKGVSLHNKGTNSHNSIHYTTVTKIRESFEGCLKIWVSMMDVEYTWIL